jgi:hypothetical protein
VNTNTIFNDIDPNANLDEEEYGFGASSQGSPSVDGVVTWGSYVQYTTSSFSSTTSSSTTSSSTMSSSVVDEGGDAVDEVSEEIKKDEEDYDYTTPDLEAEEEFPIGDYGYSIADASVANTLDFIPEAGLSAGIEDQSDGVTGSSAEFSVTDYHPYHEQTWANSALRGTTQAIMQRISTWSQELQYSALADEASAVTGGAGLISTVVNAVANGASGFLGIATAAFLGELNTSNMPRIRNAVQQYIFMEGGAGSHLNSALSSLTADYAEGNSIFVTHSVHQHNAYSHRFVSSSITSIDTPFLELATQQTLMNSRYFHQTTDLCRIHAEYYWLRAEALLVQTSGYNLRVAHDAIRDTATSAEYIADRHVTYGGRIWRQAGQINPTAALKCLTLSNIVNLLVEELNPVAQGTMVDIAMFHKLSFAKYGVQIIGAGLFIVMEAPVIFINCFPIVAGGIATKIFNTQTCCPPATKTRAAKGAPRTQRSETQSPLPSTAHTGHSTSGYGSRLSPV